MARSLHACPIMLCLRLANRQAKQSYLSVFMDIPRPDWNAADLVGGAILRRVRSLTLRIRLVFRFRTRRPALQTAYVFGLEDRFAFDIDLRSWRDKSCAKSERENHVIKSFKQDDEDVLCLAHSISCLTPSS